MQIIINWNNQPNAKEMRPVGPQINEPTRVNWSLFQLVTPEKVGLVAYIPGKYRKFGATVAVFRGKVDGNEQQLVFQVYIYIYIYIYMYIFLFIYTRRNAGIMWHKTQRMMFQHVNVGMCSTRNCETSNKCSKRFPTRNWGGTFEQGPAGEVVETVVEWNNTGPKLCFFRFFHPQIGLGTWDLFFWR